ncbi:MAG: PAS domain S-box protein [Candidatus Omnitrophota bacterium]
MKKEKKRNDFPSGEPGPKILSSVAEQVSDAIIVTDLDFRIRFVNKAVEDLYGYSRKYLLGKDPGLLNVEPLAEDIQQDIYRTVSSGKVWIGSHANRRKDGSAFLCEMKISPMYDQEGKVYSYISIQRDITEKKKAEELLREKESLYRLVVETQTELICRWQPGGKLTFVNEAYCRYFSKNRDELIAENFLPYIYPDDLEAVKRNFAALTREHPLMVHEHRVILSNGEIRWHLWTNRAIFNEHGEIVEYQSVGRDISEKKKSEQDLRESEEKYRKLIEAAGDAIFLADVDTGYIVDANKRAEELIGIPVERIIGLHQTELHPRGEAYLYRQFFIDHTDKTPGYKATAFVQHQDGHKIPVQISGNVIELKGRKIMIGIFRDITDFRAMEERLKKDRDGLEKIVDEKTKALGRILKELEDAQRLSEIGTLAATVAHELRNPLGVIRTAAYNIKKKSGKSSSARHIMNIEKKVEESEQIIRNLLNYAHIKIPRYEKVSPVKILKDCLRVCQHKYTKHHVKIHIQDSSGERDFIDADPLHVSQLFSNILDNAYQSFSSQKGRVDIRVQHDKLKNEFFISFHDNGTGIDKKDLRKIFDPFFTTKSKGTGLGLTVCNQLVNLYGGKIDVVSIRDEGTTVSIILPISKDF